MREYMVRMVIRTNDAEPDHPAYGDRPYHDDAEMPRVLRDWFDGALEDRDDSPHIVWSEFRMRPTLENHTHGFKLPVQAEDRCTAFKGCTVTYAQERARTEAGHE